LLHLLLGIFMLKSVYLYNYWYFAVGFPCVLTVCCIFYSITSCCHANDEAVYIHRQLQRDQTANDKHTNTHWQRTAVKILQTFNAALMVVYICVPTFLYDALCFQVNESYCKAGMTYLKFPKALLLGSSAVFFMALEYNTSAQRIFFSFNFAFVKGGLLISLVPLCFVPLNYFYGALGVWFTICAVVYSALSLAYFPSEIEFIKANPVKPPRVP